MNEEIKDTKRRKRICACGDPDCTKPKRQRPLSGMARIEPIVNSQHKATEPIEFDDDGEIVGELPPTMRKRVNKLLDKKNLSSLYSRALGLPSRARRYVKKVWKLQDKSDADWERVSDEMAAISAKILQHRVEIITYTGIAMSREGKLPDDKIIKVSSAMAEADAIITIYSHLFLPGMSARLASSCIALAEGGKNGYVLGGVVDVVDYGRYSPPERHQRRAEAEADMKTNGWKMPKRDYK